MGDYKVISADSHVEELAEVHDVPSEYRERAPHVETIDGQLYHIVEGMPPRLIEPPGRMTQEEKRKEFRSGDDIGFGANRGGGTDIPLRLKDQEEDGISSEVIYPSGIFRVFVSKDPAFQIALARAYNDFYAENFKDYPDRFIPSAIVPTLDIASAVGEVQRVSDMGFRSYLLTDKHGFSALQPSRLRASVGYSRGNGYPHKLSCIYRGRTSRIYLRKQRGR